MKKVIVFGGSGFLGAYVVDELLHRGYDITIADIVKPENLNSNIKFEKIDILNFEKIHKHPK